MTIATTDNKRRALGKGLDSLLPRIQPTSVPASAQTLPPAESEGGKPREIAVDEIDRNPYQTRLNMNEGELAELAASITANGVVQPILVRRLASGRYQLIAGERRWRASQLAGKKTVPSILRQVSDEQALEITIVENLQRADLNAMEQARAFERLSREFHMTQEQIATRTGKDRVSVSNYIRLLSMPESVQQLVESGKLTFGHAKALLGLKLHPDFEKAAFRVANLSLSVRQTENLVQGILFPDKDKKEPKPEIPVDPNVKEVEEQLQRALGLKVRIEDKNGRGRVVIEYANIADFDGLLEQLASR